MEAPEEVEAVGASADDDDRAEIRTRHGRGKPLGPNPDHGAVEAAEAAGERFFERDANDPAAQSRSADLRPEVVEAHDLGIHGWRTDAFVHGCRVRADASPRDVDVQPDGLARPRMERTPDGPADLRTGERIGLREQRLPTRAQAHGLSVGRAKSALRPLRAQAADAKPSHRHALANRAVRRVAAALTA